MFTELEGTWPWPFPEDGMSGINRLSDLISFGRSIPGFLQPRFSTLIEWRPLTVLSIYIRPSPWSIATEDRVLVPTVTLVLHAGLRIY